MKYNARMRCVTALVPVAPLMPPVGVDAVALSSSSVLVSWTDSWSASDSATAAVYTVRCGRRTQRGRYRYVNVSTTTTTRLDDLRPHTEYEISVQVSRARRHSTWSMSVLVTTKHARTYIVLTAWHSCVSLLWHCHHRPVGPFICWVLLSTNSIAVVHSTGCVYGI